MASQFKRKKIGCVQDLTPFDRKICIYIARGFSSEEIGKEVYRTKNAIELYVWRLLDSIGVRNRAHLVAWFYSNAFTERNLTDDSLNQSKSLTVQ